MQTLTRNQLRTKGNAAFVNEATVRKATTEEVMHYDKLLSNAAAKMAKEMKANLVTYTGMPHMLGHMYQ